MREDIVGTAQTVIRTSHTVGQVLARALLDPSPALDLGCLSAWKIFQAERRLNLCTLLRQGGIRRVHLSKGIFDKAATSTAPIKIDVVALPELVRFETGSIYILNNNDIEKLGLKVFLELYLSSPGAFVIVWDFDNHHALASSLLFAAFSDLYVPCHHHNVASIGFFSDAITAPVEAGVIQWTRSYLEQALTVILREYRDTQPLGRHIVYDQFKVRNRSIGQLSGHFAHVGPVLPTYHQRSDDERLVEWCSHMSHWIIPTLNDVPLRIFDALITGGVPIVPSVLRFHTALADVREHIVFYNEADLANPWPVTNAANEKFVKGGRDGIIARHRAAMDYCHVDSKVEKILSYLDTEISTSC